MGCVGGGGGGCITQAKSQERANSATWAAMGALAGLNQTGEGGGRGRAPKLRGEGEGRGICIVYNWPWG